MFSFRSQATTSSPARQFVRNATSKRTPPRADKRIPVQLLKDFANIGVRGEVVKVLPSVMRNYLHMNNGAAYITKDKGPRIPVVDRSVFLAQQDKIKKKEIEEKAAKLRAEQAEAASKEKSKSASALSLDELSNLFQFNKSKRAKASISSPAEGASEAFTDEVFFTSLDVTQAIPATYSVSLSNNITLPITKEFLVGQFYNTSGLEVPATALKFKSSEGADLAEITATGSYTLSIEVPNERNPVTRALVVQ